MAMKKIALSILCGLLVISIVLFVFLRNPWQYHCIVKEEPRITEGISSIYPKQGTLFPPEFPSPTIEWKDTSGLAQKWYIRFKDQNRVIYQTIEQKSTFRPKRKVWQRLKQLDKERNIEISLLGIRGFATVVSKGKTYFQISKDSVDGCLFFRAVPLPFEFAKENLDSIRWHLGHVGLESPPPALLKNLPLCGNCHSFTRDGKTIAMDVDYANDKGSYIISQIEKETIFTPDKIISWRQFDPRFKTFGLLSQISPDGRYVLSTVKDRSIFVPKNDLHYSQLFFPIKGIIAVYDRKTQKFWALPGADDPRYTQSNSTWSPDGKMVYFARAPVYYDEEAEKSEEAVLPTSVASEFIEGTQGYQYDIYRVPFNEGKGGKPEPVPGASHNGMSNYFPRISPDGKWLVFTQAKNFMLLQPDSKLYIMPAQGGTPRFMRCNTDSMNSWHTWSPNGKWLAFASKIRGPYTVILLTHIDSLGNDSPPVILERFQFSNRAANIPEFVNLKSLSTFIRIVDQFSQQSHYYYTIGRNKIGEKKFTEAIVYFDKTLKEDPNFIEAILYKAHALNLLNQWENAVALYDQYLSKNPKSWDAWMNRGSALYHLKKYKEALHSYEKAIEINAKDPYTWYAKGSAKAKLEDYRGAISDFDRAIALGRKKPDVFYERGLCKALLNDFTGAIQDFLSVVSSDPYNGEAWKRLGNAYYKRKQYPEAEQAYTRAIQLMSQDRECYSFRAQSRFLLKNYPGTIADCDEALRIDPRSGIDYYRRALAKLELHDQKSACEDLKMAKAFGIQEAKAKIEKVCQ